MAATRITKLILLSVLTVATTAGLTLAPGTAAMADPGASLIGPGPGYDNDPHAVDCVQFSLGLERDLQFGQETYDAVRALQQEAGLSVDGIVGRRTGDLILADLSQRWKEYCYPYVPTTWIYT